MASLTTLVLAIDARQAAVGGNQFVAATNNIKIGAARAATANKTLGGSFGTLAKQMGKAFLVFKALQGIKGTTRTIADFEETMKTVELVTRSATAQMEQMTEVARVLGATTRYTANEAAEGMLQLARAGFSAEESMRAIKDSLDLATAGGLTLAESTQYMANSIRQFALDASDAGRVANVFTVISNNANMTVRDMAESMKYAGTVAASTGVSIEETAAAMGVLADRGIRGTRAGTQFRGVMLALAGPTKRTMEALKQMNVAYRDVNPAAKSLTQIMDALRKGVDSLENPMEKANLYARIFTRRQVAAGLALTEMNGHLKDQIKLVGETTDEHTRMARELEQTVVGKWIAFQSAMQEVALDAGDAGLVGVMHDLLDVLVDVTRIVGEVDGAWQKAGLAGKALAVAVTAITVAGAAFVALKLATFLGALGLAAISTAAQFGTLTFAVEYLWVVITAHPIGAIVTAVGLAVAGFVAWSRSSKEVTVDLSALVKEAERVEAAIYDVVEAENTLRDARTGGAKSEIIAALRGQLRGLEDYQKKLELSKALEVKLSDARIAGLDEWMIKMAQMETIKGPFDDGADIEASAGGLFRSAALQAVRGQIQAIALELESLGAVRGGGMTAIQDAAQDTILALEDENAILAVLGETARETAIEQAALTEIQKLNAKSVIQVSDEQAQAIRDLIRENYSLKDAVTAQRKSGTAATVESTRAIESWIRSGNEQLAVMEKQQGLSGVFGPEYENAMKKAAISAEASARIASMNKDKMAPEKYTEMVAKIKEMELALLGEVDAMTLLAEKREYAENAAQAFTNAFGSIISGANSAKDAVKGLIEALIQMALQKSLLGPMQDALSGMFMGLGGAAAGGGGGGWDTGTQGGLGGGGGGWVARGGVMENGNLTRYAYGGVVDSPMYFPTRSGTGLMAEAGSPEAIMPLKRGKDGKLGVASDGGGGGPRVVNVSMNVQTKDADSFRRSRVQIQSDLKRMTTNMGLS